MEQIIVKNRDQALTFCEGGKRNSQRVAYWKEGEQIYKFERLPGEERLTWQKGVGDHWWTDIKTVAQKFTEIDNNTRKERIYKENCIDIKTCNKNAPSLTVRNIPPETHRKLKIIAAESGLSMQGITLALIEDFVGGGMKGE